MVDGSFWVLRLLPPLKLIAMILLKVALNTINQSNQVIADFTAFSILLDLPKSANFGKVLFLVFFSTLHRPSMTLINIPYSYMVPDALCYFS
jgi:hypothetical protein